MTYVFLSAECSCNSKGTNSCSRNDGSCNCLIGYSGDNCNTCSEGYEASSSENGQNTCTSIVEPIECNCNSKGSTCLFDGSCLCQPGYTGNTCNLCDDGYKVSSTENLENTCEPEGETYSTWNENLM